MASGWKESGEASWRRRAGVGGEDAGRAQDRVGLGAGRGFNKELKRKEPPAAHQGGSTEEPSSGENGGQYFSTDGEPAGAEMEGKLKGKYGSLQRERRTAFSTAKEK